MALNVYQPQSLPVRNSPMFYGATASPDSYLNIPGMSTDVGNAATAWRSGNVGDIINFLKPQREAMLNSQLQRQLALQKPGIDMQREQLAQQAAQFGQTFPESQRQFNTTSQLEQDRLAEMQRQFGLTFPESQRQFDLNSWLANQHFYDTLGYNYSSLTPQYLNSILSLLHI